MIFEQQHILDVFLKMKLRPVDAWAHDNPAMRETVTRQILHFPAFALPDSIHPVAICGLIHDFGVGTAWMVTGEGFEKSARRVLSIQRCLYAGLYKSLGLHRMDMEVETGRVAAERWAESLGFVFETVLLRRGPGGENQSVFLWPDERNNERNAA